MGLKLVKDSGWWYGVIKRDGQRKTLNLRVKVRGTRPASLREPGDVDFEESRREALNALKTIQEEAADQRGRERLIEKLRSESGRDSIRVEEIDAYAKGILQKAGRGKAHIQDVSRTLASLTVRLPPKLKADQITVVMVREWWESLSGSARNLNKKKNMVQWLFRQLIADGFADRSPAGGLRTVKGEPKTREPYTPEDIAAILEKSGDFAPVVICALTTGLRMMDCVGLRWENVDTQAGWIHLNTRKTLKPVEIPLLPRLREALGEEKPMGFCFPKHAKMNRSSITHIFTRIRRAANVQGNKDFHSFRLTWITEALSAGVPMEIVRRVTGHSSVETVLKHYFRPGREQAKKAFRQAMPAHISGMTGEKEKLLQAVEGLDAEKTRAALAFVNAIEKTDDLHLGEIVKKLLGNVADQKG